MKFPGVYRWWSDHGMRLVIAYNPGRVNVTVIETATLHRHRVPMGQVHEDADTEKLSIKRVIRKMDRRRKMFNRLPSPPTFAEDTVVTLRKSIVDK